MLYHRFFCLFRHGASLGACCVVCCALFCSLYNYGAVFLLSFLVSASKTWETQVTLEVTEVVAPASTGVTGRVLTVPATPGPEREGFVPDTGAVFSWAVHERFHSGEVTLTVYGKSSSVDAASTTSVTTSRPVTPVTVPVSTQIGANTSLVPSPAGTGFSFSPLQTGDYSALFALSTNGGSLCA